MPVNDVATLFAIVISSQFGKRLIRVSLILCVENLPTTRPFLLHFKNALDHRNLSFRQASVNRVSSCQIKSMLEVPNSSTHPDEIWLGGLAIPQQVQHACVRQVVTRVHRAGHDAKP